MNNSYFINHKEYTQAELTTHAENQLIQSRLAEWERDLYSFIVQWFSETEFVQIYTSGSTGSPKEIKIAKERMLRSAKRTLQYFEVKPFENILLCLSVKYIAGMMMVVRAFAGSLNLITLPAQQFRLNNLKDSIDFASMVPLQMERLLNEHQNLDGMRKLLLGGTPVSPSLAKKLRASFKGQIWETYGMTETITHVAVRKINEEAQIFHGLPGIAFSMDDRECLVIADHLISDCPVLTNDRIELLSTTSFRLLGRFDNVINSGGIKIQPEEVERLFESFIEGRFCITSIADEMLGEIVVLVVEKGANANLIRKAVSAIDNIYQRPKKVVELEQIPLTSNGKIDYKAVKDKLSDDRCSRTLTI